MIKITFPDGSVREYNEGVTGLQIAESISSRLAQDVLACGVNGETIDLSRPINEDANSCPPNMWCSWPRTQNADSALPASPANMP